MTIARARHHDIDLLGNDNAEGHGRVNGPIRLVVTFPQQTWIAGREFGKRVRTAAYP